MPRLAVTWNAQWGWQWKRAWCPQPQPRSPRYCFISPHLLGQLGGVGLVRRGQRVCVDDSQRAPHGRQWQRHGFVDAEELKILREKNRVSVKRTKAILAERAATADLEAARQHRSELERHVASVSQALKALQRQGAAQGVSSVESYNHSSNYAHIFASLNCAAIGDR